MASLDSRFSRPSTTAFGMGALGVLSVGLITGGLWYDSHRSAEAVDRAREQVSAGQSAQLVPEPEPVAATTSERPASDEPTSEPSERSTESSAEESSDISSPAARAQAQQWSAAQQSVEVPYVAPATSVPTAVAARRAPAVAAQPAPAAAQPSGGDTTARETTTPDSPELEVTQPGEAGFPLPRLPEVLLPFFPQADPAPQARLAPQGDPAQQSPAADGQAPAADAAAGDEG